MKNFLVLRFFVLARRLVKIQAERLELESEAPGGREFVVRFVKPESESE